MPTASGSAERPAGAGPARLLAIETAARRGSVAIADAQGGVLERAALDPRNAASVLAPTVARLLDAHGPPTGYAVDVGPGSFTGLRVGVAFLKGLARARPAPVAVAGALEVLAADLLGPRRAALAVLAASGGQVFAGLFSGDAGALPAPDPRVPVGLWTVEALASRLEGLEGLVVGGEGAPRLPAPLLERHERGGAEVPRAETLARLAALRMQSGEVSEAARVEPAYHQLSAAEAKLQKTRSP